MDVSPDQLMEQAKERFALQDYYGCIHLLEDVVESGRAFADAYHLLGLAFHLVDQPERALELLDHALSLNPNYVEACLHRGLVLNTLGRSDDAEAAFARARGIKGQDQQGISAFQAAKLANQHAALGEAYSEAGALPPAIEQYRAALRLGPGFHDPRYRLARLLLEAGRALDAREELQQVVDARPGFVDARAALGMAYYVSGDMSSAQDIWTKLEHGHPGDGRAKAYLALLERSQSK